jgi:hypothetical protein
VERKSELHSGIAPGSSDSLAVEIEIIPLKEKMKGDEIIGVKLLATDWDESPLGDLLLKVTATAGSIDPQEVSTTASGEALVKFTAPCEPGKCVISASCVRISSDGQIREFTETKEVVVLPGNQFRMNYTHTSTQDYGGQLLLNSLGSGIIVCNINWEMNPPSVTGTGLVVSTWTGNSEQCNFSGKSQFKVNYEGEIVTDEGNAYYLEIRKVSETDLGGKFTLKCGDQIQDIPGGFPIPLQDENRVLKFNLESGATISHDVGGTGTVVSYALDMGCKKE